MLDGLILSENGVTAQNVRDLSVVLKHPTLIETLSNGNISARVELVGLVDTSYRRVASAYQNQGLFPELDFKQLSRDYNTLREIYEPEFLANMPFRKK